MNTERLNLYIVKYRDGYNITDGHNFYDDDAVFATPEDAYAACASVWPNNSLWDGKYLASRPVVSDTIPVYSIVP
jgi:hypothetical protein